jgi:hypothetical protein
MTTLTVYKIRFDGVFDGEVELPVADPAKSPIPPGHTRQTPYPIPDGHYAIMQRGWRYIQGVPPSAIEAATPTQMASIRVERDARLLACDWTQLDDTPLSNTAKASWASYRQALRDVPSQEGFPWNVVWPPVPGE